MISDSEELLQTLALENERLKRENAAHVETITSYINKNNTLWNLFASGKTFDEYRKQQAYEAERVKESKKLDKILRERGQLNGV